MFLEDEFGDIIGKARTGREATVIEIADEVGISALDMQAIEDCRLTPDLNVARRLAQALALDVDKAVISAQNAWTPAAPDLSALPCIVEAIRVSFNQYHENSYVVACRNSRQAAVVDPGGAVDDILKIVQDNELNLMHILVTHSHSDHIGGLRALLEMHPAAVVVSSTIERDALTLGSYRWQAADADGVLELGDLKVNWLSTPGHTPGSVCYSLPKACFVGDTLFAGSIGRPAGKNAYLKMLDAIRSKILSLPDNTAILPGHGPVTTVLQEKTYNPFF